MKYLKKFENRSNDELLDIFSELELNLPVKVEYFSPSRKFSDFDYESICIIPESEVDADKLMAEIGLMIRKAEDFGYRRIFGRTLPWCLIEASEGEGYTKVGNFISTKSNQETDDITNWRKWGWRKQFKPSMYGYVEKSAEEPINVIITEINIYFEIPS